MADGRLNTACTVDQVIKTGKRKKKEWKRMVTKVIHLALPP